MSKIYTKTGDKGKTSLIGGTKVPKSDDRIEAYGTIDELNSYIGLVTDLLITTEGAPTERLREIQDRLFTAGAALACDPEKEPKLKVPDLKESDIVLLEQSIDEMNAQMPPLTSFILPGGHPAISTAHIARTVCRRAERNAVRLQETGALVEPMVIKYLNRLSDYLFVLARFTAFRWNLPEIPWRPRVNP